MEAGTGRDLEKRGRDRPRHMTHHSSWHWHETFTAPRLLSLPLPPSSSAVPAARLSPLRSRQQVPRHFFPTKLPGHMAAHTCSPWRHLAPRSRVLLVWSVGDGWEQSCLATEASRSLLEPPIACRTPFNLLPSQLLQAGMPGQPPPQLEPLGIAEAAPSSPHQLHPGLPWPIPTCSLLNILAQPHPHGSHLGCPSPQMEPIGNRGHHHPLPWTPPQPLAVEKIEEKIEKLGW